MTLNPLAAVAVLTCSVFATAGATYFVTRAALVVEPVVCPAPIVTPAPRPLPPLLRPTPRVPTTGYQTW